MKVPIRRMARAMTPEMLKMIVVFAIALTPTLVGGTQQIEAVKKAALEHGVAYAPLGPHGDTFGLRDLETTVTAVFDVNETVAVHACGKQRVLGASGKTQMAAIPSASTITTEQTRAMPTVKWNCKPEKLYSMVMYDAFNGPITNMSFGYTHWIKINIPCDSATTLATSTGGVTFGEINYFHPDNFGAEPHNYGFYILEQRGATAITPTQTELERFDRANIRNGESLRRFIEWVSDKGPIARTWAGISVSAWSAFTLDFAGFAIYASIACGNLGLTESTVRAVTTTPIAATVMANETNMTTPVRNDSLKNHVVAPKEQHHLAIAAVTYIIALVYPFIKKER